MDEQEISAIINELGEEREFYFNAVTPPIIQTSNFAFRKVDQFREAIADESAAYIYSRATNPTLKILAQKLAALDGAEDCLLINSGAGAVFTAVMANLKSGDHLISVMKPYTWAQKMFDEILPRFNISTTYVDGRQIDNFKNAILPHTKLIYLETPNSWSFYLQDLKAVAQLAQSHNILTICDNSYCSPLYQRPIEYGIDISLQSATKYINGHSDVVAGIICGSRKMIEKIFKSEYMNMGIGTTPFNAWLLTRGLRTLPLRLERSSQSALKVIEFLYSRKEVEDLSYPFDPHFPQYELSKKQMKGSGGLFSFLLKTKSLASIESFCESLNHFVMAVSWGGNESLIMPGCVSIPKESFDPNLKDHRRIRMYVGLEDPGLLIKDLEEAFQKSAF